ncbi:MAG: acyl-CoA dehydrogenase family protein [Gemmatimonas sp.]|jgi:alkylation response protein AidB-like acyl-CoA dehydrogenase|uniref:acyl-CoA dehydrogenase family protein n=1 Tax=Gemmatimonas sp. TaxID=1962908 RepID=UPI00391FBF1B|nr:acyl-CoA dehydrogenase family protein [Gemmatimonadota bacterium]
MHAPTASSPSFLRDLFAGDINESLLFPYPATLDVRNPEEARTVQRLVGAVNDMLASGLIDSRRFDEQEGIDEAVIAAFARAGLLALTIPKAYGGLGLSASAYARVFGAVASIDASLGVLIGVHCGLGSKAIVLAGNDAQQARYLPMLARGETLAAYALTEPETGSDAQNIVTRAERSADDTGWVLNGRKHWIGNGQRAGVIATFAQTPIVRDGQTVMRPTAFIIRPDMPGFRVDGTIRKLGIRGSTQAELVFENLFVPDDHVLGEVGKGFRVAVNALNAGRLSLASGCAQGCKRLLDEFTRYAETRTQFGGPLASYEITQRKMATIASETYATDAMVGALASALDAENVDASLEAACAKVFASELVWRVSDELVQLAGGRGFVQPWPYERWLRDARINRIFEGANEILRLFVGLNGVQGPAEELKEIAGALRNPIQNWVVVSGYAAERVASAFGKRDRFSATLHTALRRHAEYVEKHVAELAKATQQAIATHRTEILQRQLVVERLADMAIELYARSVTIARTQRLLEERGANDCAREIALTALFCLQSGRRFRALRRELDSEAGVGIDSLRRDIAARVRAEGGYRSSDALLDAPVPPLPAWSLVRDDQQRAVERG